MSAITTTISIPEALLNQAETLARQLGISPDALFQMAVEQLIGTQQDRLNPNEPSGVSDRDTGARTGDSQLVINQGDVYWLQPEASGGAPSVIRHPHVIVQENIFNHSRIPTVIVCALTSNLKRASFPGNVLLEAHEAGLPKPSVVEVSKVAAVAKAQLGEYIGSVSERRVQQILAGMRLLHASFFTRP